MEEIIFLVEESPEGGYEARALGYSIYTEAEDLDKLRDAVRDAMRCHFKEEEMPRIIRLHMVKDYRLIESVRLGCDVDNSESDFFADIHSHCNN